jgi:signal transduction histidine kinase/ActR/RegA family two-component response regulator
MDTTAAAADTASMAQPLPLAEAAPPPAPVRRAPTSRFVAVDSPQEREGTGDSARTLRAQRHRILVTAAMRSAFEQVHVVGASLLTLVPLAWLLAGAEAAGQSWPGAWAPALWSAAAAALGAAMVAWPRRRWRPGHSNALLTGLVGAAALLAALPAGLPHAAGAAGVPPAWVWVTAAFAIAAAGIVAPSAPAATAVAVAPLVAAILALVALTSGPAAAPPPAFALLPTAAAGLWGAVVALGVGWHLRRRWRRQMLLSLEQAARLRETEAERDTALRADSDKSRFLAIASHDLRQPVHALGLFAATLHKRLHASPDEALARNLMRSVDGLERSFNAMLDISRLDGDAVTPKPQTFPLRDIFRRLHMQYAGQAELAGLALRFSPGGRSVTSDPQLLERIVGNLVHNAIRYTTAGGIVVVARGTRTHVNIEVWDTGAGIAEADLPRIFDEFFQVDRGERDRGQGLGMGLAIVKRLAALLGHRLEVASAPGRGTMFRVGVPLGTLGDWDEEMAPADTLPMSVEMTGERPQMVLVVDDEEPIREGLRLLLQEWGYQAMTAADAVQAERAVAALEGRVDLILSDLHFGTGTGGREVVASVRRLTGRDIPAILVTGDTAGQALREVVGGTDPVLFKPVQPRQLFEAMRAALQ